jgi:hypothetical protein
VTILFVTAGTIAVTNGSPTVEGTGTGWLPTSVKQGDTIMIGGVQYWIDAIDEGAQELTLITDYEGATDDGLAYAIMPTSPEWVRNVTITQHLAQQILAQQAIGGSMMVAVSDESTAISSGTNKLRFRAPQAMRLRDIRASLNVASSSGVVTIDVNVNGATILSTKLTIDQGETTSVTAAVAAVLSSVEIEEDDLIAVDLDTAGSGASGLKLTFIAEQP